jgi:mono/diheme cytochrome c family protein
MTLAKRMCAMAGIVGVVLTAAAVRLSGAQAQKQTGPQIKQVPYEPIVSMEGKDNFMAYCAACHGADGKGHGPAAPALKGPIPDLTTIAKRRGKFDAVSIQRVVSGADKVPSAHGSVEMPVWGPLFRGSNRDTAVEKMRLAGLIEYLKSIQAE